MPPAPRSPRPRIRSPSVTTMKRTSFSGQLESSSFRRPRADRQIHAARLTKDVSELLACLPDGRRVDEGHVGGGVRHEDRVIERLVARLQIREHEVLLQIVLETGDLDVPARHLQRHRGDGRWQQTFKTPRAALRLGESGPFVDARIAQQVVAGGLPPCGHIDCSVRGTSRVLISYPSNTVCEPNALNSAP